MPLTSLLEVQIVVHQRLSWSTWIVGFSWQQQWGFMRSLDKRKTEHGIRKRANNTWWLTRDTSIQGQQPNWLQINCIKSMMRLVVEKRRKKRGMCPQPHEVIAFIFGFLLCLNHWTKGWSRLGYPLLPERSYGEYIFAVEERGFQLWTVW